MCLIMDLQQDYTKNFKNATEKTTTKNSIKKWLQGLNRHLEDLWMAHRKIYSTITTHWLRSQHTSIHMAAEIEKKVSHTTCASKTINFTIINLKSLFKNEIKWWKVSQSFFESSLT